MYLSHYAVATRQENGTAGQVFFRKKTQAEQFFESRWWPGKYYLIQGNFWTDRNPLKGWAGAAEITGRTFILDVKTEETPENDSYSGWDRI